MKRKPIVFGNSLLILLLFSVISCKKPNKFLNGPFADFSTIKKWKLVKIESKNSPVKIGNQIGYIEIFEHDNDKVDTYDRIVRDEKEVAYYRMNTTKWPVEDMKNRTFSVYYEFGLTRRDFKITIPGSDYSAATLVASGYLDESKNQPDTIKYYYEVYK